MEKNDSINDLIGEFNSIGDLETIVFCNYSDNYDDNIDMFCQLF